MAQPAPTASKRHPSSEVDTSNIRILFYSSTQPEKRANAIFLICAWQVLEMRRTPEQAYYGFQFYQNTPDPTFTAHPRNVSKPPAYPLTSIAKATVASLPSFHDASPCICTYELNVLHCLEGIVKAKQFGFFDWDTFDVEEYEHFEQVEVSRLCYALSLFLRNVFGVSSHVSFINAERRPQLDL